MSGICAIYRPTGEPIREEEINTLLVAGAHRGVDGVERRLEGPLGLGHLTQQSADHRTTGLSATSDFSLSLSADSRLDRDAQTERNLRDQGLLDPIEAATDGEIILAAYRHWGHRAVEHLHGDFAFVLWDREKRTLLLARDRLGAKPLCYAETDQGWFIASEAQQIVALPGFERRLDRRTIARQLAGCLPPDNRTLFAGIQQLQPAHWMVVSRDGIVRRQQYWEPGSQGVTTDSEELLSVLRDSVDRRLRRPRGPVGVLMSGGLDSCSVAALAHETLGPDLRGVTHAFDVVKDCDERQYTEAMREKFGFPLEYNLADELAFFPSGREHPDPEDPFLGWTAIHEPAFKSLESAGARVVLTGHGGDSVFGGSPLVYSDQLRAGRFGEALADLRRHARERNVPLRSLIYHYLLVPRLPALADARARALFRRPPRATLPDWLEPGLVEETGLRADFESFYSPATWGKTAAEAIRSSIEAIGSVGRAVGFFDRLGHRYGIDVRHPFLDAKLIDCVLSLPPETLYAAGESKLPLRRRLTQLPPSIRTRRQKTHFRAFTDHRLRGADRTALLDLLSPAVALAELDLVNPTRLTNAVEAYLDGSNEVPGGVIFFTASTEQWLRSFPPS